MPRLRTTPASPLTIMVGGASIQVCPLSSSALSNMRRRHTTIKRGAEVIDGPALTKEIFDATVKGWDDQVKDEAGQPLPCTSEIKRLLCEHDAGFVSDVLAETDEADKLRRASEQGNLPPGPNGTSPRDE